MPVCVRANLTNDFILDITLAVLWDRNSCNNWDSSSHFLFSSPPNGHQQVYLYPLPTKENVLLLLSSIRRSALV